MLDPLDDYLIHQAPIPVALSPMGANAYDRYFFNGYPTDPSLAGTDGVTFFAVALGLYPNKGIIDGAFSAIVGGDQVSVFGSERAPTDRRRTIAGPVRVEVVEPMRVFRVIVDHPDLSADVLYRCRTAAIEEPRFFDYSLSLGGVFDYTRYTQFGEWSGTIECDGQTTAVEGWRGCRDRSWGDRGSANGAPPKDPQFFWLWAPLSFDDGAMHCDVNERADGERWHEGAFAAPLVGDADPWRGSVETFKGLHYQLTYEPDTRWPAAAALQFETWRGAPVNVDLETVGRFQMKGLGYGHPARRHGQWLGESVSGSDRIRLADVDPHDRSNLHVQQIVRATDGTRTGVGVLELLALGRHGPSGF